MTDRVDRLAAVAVGLISRVRDEGPHAFQAWLTQQVPDYADLMDVAVILAAVVPDDRTWDQLKAWIAGPPETPEERRLRQWREAKDRYRLRLAKHQPRQRDAQSSPI